MAVSLVSTGIQFPDSTIQTTAATAGAAPGMVLISSTNATASSTISALSAFSSTYDNYLIIGDGLSPASNAILQMRVAVAGSVVTSSYKWTVSNATSMDSDSWWNVFYTTLLSSSTNGCSFAMYLYDVNSTTRYKTMNSVALGYRSSSSTWQGSTIYGVFDNSGSTAALTGIQLGFFSTGVNFLAQGNVKIYGFKNS